MKKYDIGAKVSKMKLLIINDYDTIWNFTYTVFDAECNEIISESNNPKELNDFDLWDKNNYLPDYENICKDNSRIQIFKFIILCIDGITEIKVRGVDY